VKREVYFGIGHEGPEDECRYSSTFSFTSALDEGEWSTPRSLYPRERDPMSVV